MRTREIVSLLLAGGVVALYWAFGPDPDGAPAPPGEGWEDTSPFRGDKDAEVPLEAGAPAEAPDDTEPRNASPSGRSRGDRAAGSSREAARAPDELPADPRRVIPFRPGSSSDTLSLKEPTTGYVLEEAVVQASARTAFICYQGRGPYEGVTLRDVRIAVEPGTLELDRSYWAVRGYDMVDTLLENVEITGFGVVTDRHDEGHAIYLNVAGDLTLRDCFIHDNGGQGLQLVNRPKESVLPRGPAAGTITIERTRFLENGFNPDRGGFQVTIFGTGQRIVMRDVEILAGFDAELWPKGGSRGGLVIEAEPFNPKRPEKPVWWHPDDPPEGWEPPFGQGPTELTRVTVRHEAPDRPLVQIKGCEELVVRDCTFVGGKIQLDDPSKPGRDCGRIVWEGNRGSATVFHRGQRLGRASEDFVLGEPAEERGGAESESGR